MNRIRPIASGRATADFFTESYRLSASALVYKRRLLDVLSDKSTRYLELVDIYVSRINKPGDIVATYPKGVLVKEEINFILLSDEADSISKERFYASERASLPLFITLPAFEISGKFQWLGEFEMKKILNTNQPFLAIMEATISNAFFPQVTFEAPAVLINKTKVDIVCVDNVN